LRVAPRSTACLPRFLHDWDLSFEEAAEIAVGVS
jgi:hypothetical protein